MLQSFDDYRDRMLSIMANAETGLTMAPPASSEPLDLARARMARVLTAYHLYADRELFTPCATLADPVHRQRVRAVAADCARLAIDFRAFTRDCTTRPVLSRWTDYREQALAMMARIRRHLDEAGVEVRKCAALGILKCKSVPVVRPIEPRLAPARRMAFG
jgi:hypothetical protein